MLAYSTTWSSRSQVYDPPNQHSSVVWWHTLRPRVQSWSLRCIGELLKLRLSAASGKYPCAAACSLLAEIHSRYARLADQRWHRTTITNCVGIRPTKAIARLGNAAVKNRLFDSVADLNDENIRDRVLDRFPARYVCGVGRAPTGKLALGIQPVEELPDMPMEHVRGIGTVGLERKNATRRAISPSFVLRLPTSKVLH